MLLRRSALLVGAIVLLRAACAAAADATGTGVGADPPDPPDPLAPLAWLAGCWQAEGGEPGSTEQWMAPAGGVMLGMARTVKGGRVVEHEFLQIRRQPDGTLAYIALPSGQRLTVFGLKSLAAAEVVFENPAHDFPQRVIYRRTADDRLTARIEGRRNGVERGIDFLLQRVRCDGPVRP